MRTRQGLVELLKKYESDLNQIKTAQFSGSSNVVGYYNETNDTWDMEWTPSSVGGFGFAQRTVTVTFTADHKPAAFTAIEMDAYFNGTRYTSQTMPFIYQVFDRQVSSDIDIAKFSQSSVYVVQADTSQTIQLKFRASSVDTGTLNISWVTNLGS